MSQGEGQGLRLHVTRATKACHHDLFMTFALCLLPFPITTGQLQPRTPGPPLTSFISLIPLTSLPDSSPYQFSGVLLIYLCLRSRPCLGLPGLPGQLWEGRNQLTHLLLGPMWVLVTKLQILLWFVIFLWSAACNHTERKDNLR